MTPTMQILTENLGRLGANDREFAASLIASVNARTSRGIAPSEKQALWLDRLAARAMGAQQKPTTTAAIGSMDRLIAMFDKAKQHLKWPAIVFAVEGIGSFRLSVAGERARVPGSINVTEAQKNGDEGRVWFGRINRDGTFEAARKVDVPAALVDGLREFAADPAGYARRSANLTGRCCFCNQGLTDERSTTVGYGPTCAAHYGLPWGERAGEFASAADAAKF